MSFCLGHHSLSPPLSRITYVSNEVNDARCLLQAGDKDGQDVADAAQDLQAVVAPLSDDGERGEGEVLLDGGCS